VLKCSHCQWENHDAAQFCANCGNRLTAADLARPAPDAWPTQQPQAADWAVAVEEKNAAAMRLVAEGKVSEALEALNEAIRLAPNHAQFYLNRADVLARLGMMSQAEADRRMASQLSPAGGPPTESAAGTTVCPSCGQSAPATTRFCAGCGRVLSAVVYAGFWMRLLANIIDSFVLLIPSIVLAVAAPGTVGTVLGFALGLVYTVGFWTAQGATPGKMALGIKITTVGGEPIGFGRALLRYIGYCVSTITLLIGYLIVAWTPQKRGLHDYIAGTVVIAAWPLHRWPPR